MSEVVIKNAGNGSIAKVTDTGRLKSDSITEELKDHAADSEIAQKYNINTGDITLTNGTKTSVLYVKNNSTLGDLILTALIYNLGNTTGGSGDVKLDVIRNPTTGDIITNANVVLIGEGVSANQNFGSSNVLACDIYKGASGETAVNGDVTISTRSASNTGRIFISLGSVNIPQGSSIAIDYTPPSGNTSQICQFAIACYLKTDDVGGV